MKCNTILTTTTTNNDNKLLVSYELRHKVQVQLEVQDVLHLKTIRYNDVCTNYNICVCNVLYVKIRQLVC